MKNQAIPFPAIASATDEFVPPRSNATIGSTVKFIEKGHEGHHGQQPVQPKQPDAEGLKRLTDACANHVP